MKSDFWSSKLLVSPSSGTRWSQVRTWENQDELVVVLVELGLSVEAPLLELSQIGVAILQEADEICDTLGKATLADLKQRVVDLKAGVNPEIAVGVGILVIKESKLRVARVGSVEVNLWRAGARFTLLNSGEESEGVVGELSESDRVVMLSSGLAKAVSVQQDQAGWQKELESKVFAGAFNEGWSAVILEKNVQKKAGISGWKTKIQTLLKPRTEDEPSIYVESSLKNNKYRVGVALLILLICTIGLGIWRKSVVEKEERRAQVLEMIERSVAEAGRAVKTNPDSAKRILDETKYQVMEYQKVAGRGEREEILGWLARIEQEMVFLVRQNQVEVTTWAELSILKAESAKQMVLVDGNLAYLKSEDGWVGVSLSDKSQVRIENTQDLGVRDFAIIGKRMFALVEGGIWGGEISSNKVTMTEKIAADEAWNDPIRMLSFGQSLYVVDRGTGEISKYATSQDSVSSRVRWFGRGVVLDLGKIVDVVVDGDVWLLSSSGKLEKYSRGVPVKWEMRGYANEAGEVKLTEPVAVSTTEEEVYILEKGRGRVVVFDREGNYLRQYISEKFGHSSDLVILEEKAYVLGESEIMSFDL